MGDMTDKIIEAAREAEAYATSQTNDIVDWKAIAQERFYAIAFAAGMERAAHINAIKPTRRVTYTCPACHFSLERQE